MVVIEPFSMPNFSCSTLTTGARQLVVQDAFEITLGFAGSYALSLTPSTIVRSSFLPGAEMITFLTEPRRCLQASLASVNLPVDSMTTCAPSPDQSISPGSLIAKILIRLPFTTIASASALTSSCSGPRIESYFNKCASVLVSVRSLAATNSIPGRLSPALTTFLPIRPKPLIPTLIGINSRLPDSAWHNGANGRPVHLPNRTGAFVGRRGGLFSGGSVLGSGQSGAVGRISQPGRSQHTLGL